MMKLVALSLFVVACGGSQPAPVTPAAPPAEPAAPAEAAPAAPANDVLAQAALAEQYDRGKRLSTEKKCASCHEANGQGNPKNPAVIGPAALPHDAPAGSKLRAGITFTTAADVLAFVKAKMPIKAPGTLSDTDAEAITSWILSESKVNITAPLTAANAASIPLR
jgi:cytochrome c